MTCKHCRVAMADEKGHVYHGQRKFRCPKCGRAKLQKPRKARPPRRL